MNKNKIAVNFNRAAQTYDQHAILQQDLGNYLLEKIIEQKIRPAKILDLGCGTGLFTNKLRKIFPGAKILGIDIADKMVEFAREKYPLEFICADIDNLLPDKYDLIFSNCVFQWVPNLNVTLKKIKNMLSKNGVLFFSSFLDGTLQELQEVLGGRCINNFITFAETENILSKMQYQNISLKSRSIQIRFDNLIGLIQYLRNIGANYSVNYNTSMIGAKILAKAAKLYQDQFNATFNVVYGSARN